MKPIGTLAALLVVSTAVPAATTQRHYYAHDAVADRHGVIAPWYAGSNGQLDWRLRIAAETLKRYPWVQPPQVPAAAPAYVYSGHWKIAPDGAISLPPLNDWNNGDWGQRASYVLTGFVDYYRYSGDPAAIAHLTYQADVLLDHCQTPKSHPWPRFPISVPIKGKPFGDCDPAGMIQLDIVAEIGIPLIRTAQLTGNSRYMSAARHWGDLFAANCDRTPGRPPWNRYANPESAPWSEDHQTGGIVFILAFLDELIRAGYTGSNNSIIEARDIGRRYLNDVLLPRWTVNDVWGRNYWDWPDPVQAENVTEFAARYLMENPDVFPNWKNDARNIMTLFLNHTSVDAKSGGDVYHGAWAYPESSGCCGRSLWYGPMELVNTYAQYAVLTDSEWARELARRQMILATYDGHDTGVVEDNIDGGAIVAADWFKIAHPMALKHCLAAIAWMPEVFGAPRENHIVRSTSVVKRVHYGVGHIEYATADAPPNTREWLRLAFRPRRILVDGKELPAGSPADAIAYEIKDLPGGDCLLAIRHDGAKLVQVEGDNPQESVPDLDWSGKWDPAQALMTDGREVLRYRHTDTAGAAVTCRFEGNQVRLMGTFGPQGGTADVYLDDVKQLVGIDCWTPEEAEGVLYYRNGLKNGPHTLKVVVRGQGNPRSKGKSVCVRALYCSAATGGTAFGEGSGPTDAQRMIFGYTGREDFIDSRGHAWRPGTEFIIRTGGNTDSVEKSWWTQPRRLAITGTDNPELYRYGIHGPAFNIHVTVGPGTYYARLKFAETRNIEARLRTVTISVNGREMIANMDIAATALQAGTRLDRARSAERTSPAAGSNRSRGSNSGTPELRNVARLGRPHPAGLYTAVNIVIPDIQPVHGIIDLHLTGPPGGEAILQALEVGPGDGGKGAAPVSLPPATRPASGP